jgi:Tol biopolymer transport system component
MKFYIWIVLGLFGAVTLACADAAKREDDVLARWRAGVKIQPVSSLKNRHVIHAYFNASPESPDRKFVLYYTSGIANGEKGDIRILERATGVETVLAEGITTEDAHRAACQQWSDGGKSVVFHDCRDGRWQVVAVDAATKTQKVLAQDRQLGFGSPASEWVPLYGCHWNPGVYRNLELANVRTGEIRTVVKAQDVVQRYKEWIEKRFGTSEISLFFPVISPDGKKVFFKLARPSGGTDFRSSAASLRDGKVIFDLEKDRFIRLVDQWGHPSWTPDSQGIFEKGNFVLNPETGKTTRYAPSCFSDHPQVSPQGGLFVTDADVSKRPFGKPNFWAIGVGSMQRDDFVVVDLFDNSKGARTWRHNHPHPSFSADGQRIYYNVNDGEWTRLMVAEAGVRPAQ